MIRFFLSLLALGVTLVALTWLFLDQQWIKGLPSFFFETLIFLLVSTSILYIYLYKFDKPDFFIQLYLLTMAVKFLAYGAYNFVMILEDKIGAVQNVIWFMLLYLTFTALEILFLFRKKVNS
ncbi:MAG TPA: hypothetical protein VJ184_01500 [Chryseolinea sp.]|nr:hypothetical protein [Chryseolinea sp.]